MSLLNRPSDGLLSVLLALRRAILAYGPQTEESLVALCAPAALDGKSDMARKTLTRWKQLGFFQVSKNRVEISPQIEMIGPDDVDGLRASLLRLVLDPTNNPGLIGEVGSSLEDNESSLGSDFTRAACWALAQDPYRFTATWPAVQSLQNEQAIAPRPFVNDTRWQGFAEWATFSGLAWSTVAPSRLVLDPAFAIESLLPDIFAGETYLEQTSFLTRLAQHLPVVDGGRYRTSVENQIEKPWRSLRSNEISPSLSAALLHLEENGRMEIQTRADAPQKLLLGRDGRELRSVSHFGYKKGA
jgi:hypothetical protein